MGEELMILAIWRQPQYLGKLKTTSVFWQKEEDLTIFEKEDSINFYELEDNLITFNMKMT